MGSFNDKRNRMFQGWRGQCMHECYWDKVLFHLLGTIACMINSIGKLVILSTAVACAYNLSQSRSYSRASI
jgi:hypothetical protein